MRLIKSWYYPISKFKDTLVLSFLETSKFHSIYWVGIFLRFRHIVVHRFFLLLQSFFSFVFIWPCVSSKHHLVVDFFEVFSHFCLFFLFDVFLSLRIAAKRSWGKERQFNWLFASRCVFYRMKDFFPVFLTNLMIRGWWDLVFSLKLFHIRSKTVLVKMKTDELPRSWYTMINEVLISF